MLRTVEIFEYKNKSGQVNLVSKNEFGLFHKWGDEIHAENPDGNSVSETVAIVEMSELELQMNIPFPEEDDPDPDHEIDQDESEAA